MADEEKTLTLVLKARNLANRELGRMQDGLEGVGRKARGLGSSFLALGKTAAILAGTGILALITGLGLATKAAAEEQKGIARMQAALKQNVKGWNGNTDAIEKVIAKREKLAFSDDDLRQSFGTLVTATGDVDSALARQATAMDVARLKGISLDDASKLIIKAMAGNARATKELGIELPKTATQLDILRAIQQKTAGQAEAYGKTQAGAMEAAQIAIGDLVEDVGSAFLPIMGRIARFLVDTVIPAVRDFIGKIEAWTKKNKPLIDTLTKLAGDVLSVVADWLGKIIGFIGDVIDAIADFVDGIKRNKPLMLGLTHLWEGIGKAIGIVVDAMKWILDNAAKVIDAMGPLVTDHTVQEHTQHHVQQHATGGWVGLNGPEMSLVGERGPEYITPNHSLGAGGFGGGTIVLNIDGKEVARVVTPAVSRQMYYEFQRAAPTAGRA